MCGWCVPLPALITVRAVEEHAGDGSSRVRVHPGSSGPFIGGMARRLPRAAVLPAGGRTAVDGS